MNIAKHKARSMPIKIGLLILAFAFLISPTPVFAVDPTPTVPTITGEDTQPNQTPVSSSAPTATLEPTAASESTVTASPITESPTPHLPPPAQVSGDYTNHQILVKLAARNEYARTMNFLRQNGIDPRTSTPINQMLKRIGYLILEVDPGEVAQQIAILETFQNVARAEPNYLVGINDVFTNDPHLGLQYALTNIRAPQGWEHYTGSSAVTIAVLDTGLDTTHPEFSGKIVAGYDFYNSDTDPFDDHGHGTEVSAITAAWGNNGIGIAGVSWGAQIMPVKVLSQSGGGSYATVAAGIIYAADNNAQVINLSLGGVNAPSDTVLLDAVNYAASKGVTLVASSGNTGGPVMYPAHYPNVIAVAATDASNAWASFSNSGPEIDLCAPGVSILTISQSNLVTYKNGTSFSAPHVAGMAAILLEIPGIDSPSQVEHLMKISALDVGVPGHDINCGAGLIQLDLAIMAAMPATATPTWTPNPENNTNPQPTSPPFTGGSRLPLTSYTATFPIPSDTPSSTSTPQALSAANENLPPNPELSEGEQVSIHEDEILAVTQAAIEQKVETFIASNQQITILTICSWSAILLLILVILFRRRWESHKQNPEE